MLKFVTVLLSLYFFCSCQGWIVQELSCLSRSSNSACPIASTKSVIIQFNINRNIEANTYCTNTNAKINNSPSIIQEPSLFFRNRRHGNSRTNLASTAATISESLSPLSDDDKDEEKDGDDEYEYVEYDILTESEFMGSEWLVGTVMDKRPERIDETWVRLATDRDGKSVAIWGDKSEGNWNFDVANQFLSVSKNSLLGKNIWAGVIDDYYFSRGTVRGWNFLSPASVVGQWQAKRLGVEADEAGVAPWFDDDDDDDDNDDDNDDNDAIQAKLETGTT